MDRSGRDESLKFIIKTTRFWTENFGSKHFIESPRVAKEGLLRIENDSKIDIFKSNNGYKYGFLGKKK